MRQLPAIVAILLCLASCSTFERVYTGNCVSESIFRAHVMERNGYQTRIAVMKTDNPRILHAQAQALINGEWRWLSSDRAMVYVGEKELPTEVIEYRSLYNIIGE